MSEEASTLGPGDPDADDSVVLITVLLFVAALILLGITVMKGGSGGHKSSKNISEEEKIERRKRALRRFGGADERDEDRCGHAVPIHTGQMRNNGMLRYRASSTTGSHRVNAQHAPGSSVSCKDIESDIEEAKTKSPRSVSEIGQVAEPYTVNTSVFPPSTELEMDAKKEGTMKQCSKSEEATANDSINGAEVTASGKETKNLEEPAGKRRHRPMPSPAQLLCETLSVVCGTQVTVTPGKESWGGEGWAQKKWTGRTKRHGSNSLLSTRPLPKIVLPLIQQRLIQKTSESPANHPDSQYSKSKDEWLQLDSTLQSIVSSSPAAMNPFRSILAVPYSKHGIAIAASWHSNTHGSTARDVIDNIIQSFGSDDDGATTEATREGLQQCLSSMANFVSGVLAIWLDEDISLQEQEDEESDEEDLFSDDYKMSGRHIGHSCATNSALGELLELCTKPNSNLTLPKRLFGDIIAQSSDGSRLAKGILCQALARLPAPESTSNALFETIANNLAILRHLVTNSVDVAISLSENMNREVILSPSGDAFEASSTLRSLLSLGGYTLPCIGFEAGSVVFSLATNVQSSSAMKGNRFYEALKSAEAFPLGYFDSSRGIDPSITRVIDEARSIMKQARIVSSLVLRQCMKKKGGKRNVFCWIGHLVHANEMQANLLKEQLLDDKDGVQVPLSSRHFLMGAALSLLEMCSRDLMQTYENNGTDAFDARYLISSSGLRIASSDERRLIDCGDTATNGATEDTPKAFSGATELFFLTSAMLRVSIFPGIRTRDEYSVHYKSIFSRLRQIAGDPSENCIRLPEVDKKCLAGLLGWNTCLDDSELMSRIVDFSILQLRFLADLSSRHGRAEALLALIPESMVKLPSQYIAHVAAHFQRYLSPTQAEAAVQYATIILGSDANLSIQVQTELMRIFGAFVGASVQRAAAEQRRKHRASRRGVSNDDDDLFIDMRGLEVFCSLDRKDHGVLVFASPTASKQLGPILLQTFVAMETVEGMDVEKENKFNKGLVQGEICELILRLWVHPSGEFKRSITSLGSDILNKFFSSIAASISIDCDTVYQTILDIRDLLEHRVQGHPLKTQEEARLNSCYGRLPSFLSMMRRTLLLLTYLSKDDRIAAILGGGTLDNTASSDLGIMIVGLVDKFTGSDGAAHPLVDFRVALKGTSNMTSRQSSVSMVGSVKELLGARTFAKAEFGVDVSILAHHLMALASRWTLAACKQWGQHEAHPALIGAINSHNDFNIHHFRRVFDRLIIATQSTTGANDENLVIKSDGHVDSSVWMCYETPDDIGLEESRRQRNYASQQDQLTHLEIGSIAGVDQIRLFLDELERYLAPADSNSVKSDEDVLQLECQILRGQRQDEEAYTQSLEDWIVSSDSFSNHFFTSDAKTSSNLNIGKVLLKDARKCWKNLPRPHPNASIFVCYSEERMDLCKALIIGAMGTPYSMGVFQFDICYPQLYPSAAPMVHFMTTGGGQVRFSPNLYNDGKVCISLLGNTNAWNESQRWNPNESSLAQVLLSIQSQILDVDQPYFAEGGGHGGLQGTRAGQEGSARYNNTLRLSTLRHAIIQPLKSPPKGFEDVTRRHFAMSRKRLMVQAKLWTIESTGTELHGRFLKAYSELLVLLSSDRLSCEDWELADAGGEMFGALPPLSSDLQALQRLDRNLYNKFYSALQHNHSSQSNGHGDGEDDIV